MCPLTKNFILSNKIWHFWAAKKNITLSHTHDPYRYEAEKANMVINLEQNKINYISYSFYLFLITQNGESIAASRRFFFLLMSLLCFSNFHINWKGGTGNNNFDFLSAQPNLTFYGYIPAEGRKKLHRQNRVPTEPAKVRKSNSKAE
jgi:hypothetical protein